MNRIAAFIASLVVLATSYGQPIDSLKNELEKAQAEKLTLLSAELMNAIGNAFRDENADLAEYWFLQSLESAIELEEEVLIAKNYFELAAINYRPKGELEVAMDYLNKSLPIFERMQDPKLIADNYFDIGKVALDQGNFPMGLEYLLKSLEQFEDLADSLSISEVNNSLGVLNSKQENFEKALAYHRKALEFEQRMDLKSKMGINYNNIGLTYKKMEYYDSALAAYRKGLEIEKEISFPILRGVLFDNIGNVLELLNQYDSALYYHSEALKIAQSAGYKVLIGWANHGMASTYFKLGKPKQAIPFAKKAVQVAENIGEKDILMQSAEILHKTYAELGDFRNAYDYLRIFKMNSDRLFNAENIKKTAAMEYEYQYKKNNEIQQLELQAQEAIYLRLIDREKTIVYLLVAVGTVILLFLVIIYRNYRVKKRVSVVLQDKNEIISSQAESLKKLNETKDKFYAILSHDLRGPMSVFQGVPIIVNSFLEKHRYEDLKSFAEKVGNTSQKVTGLLDDLMTWAISQKKDQIPIHAEKMPLKQAIDEIYGVFESLAETKAIKLISDIDENVTIIADKQSMMTVFRNLVNNAIKFTPESGQVLISYRSENGNHYIMVSDNGLGISKERMGLLFTLDGKKLQHGTAGEKGVGLGLQLVYDFVKMNKGQVQVESKEGVGTTFTIVLPSAA